MIKKLLSKGVLTSVAICFVFSMVLATAPVLAQNDADDLLWGGTENEVGNAIGLGEEDPRVIAASIINVILGFLGIIAVVIILLGGFKWMTAGGNEEKVGEARNLLTAGLIGLIIILASWGLAKFVIGLLYNATTGT